MKSSQVINMTMTPEEDLRSRLHLHLNQDGGNPSQLLEMLETMVKGEVWKSFGMTFAEFVEAPFEKHGLGWSMTGLKAVMYLRHRYEHRPDVGERMQELRWKLGQLSGQTLAPETTDLAHTAHPLEKHGGDRKSKEYQVYNYTLDYKGRGTSAKKLTSVIARDRPDILEDMKAGKYRSVRAAAIDAGIIDPEKTKRYSLPTDASAAGRYLAGRVDEDWISEMLEAYATAL